MLLSLFFFFFSSRRRHTRWNCDWSLDVCSSDLLRVATPSVTVFCVSALMNVSANMNSFHAEINTRIPAVIKEGETSRSEERREGKSGDIGGRRSIKKKKRKR